MIEDNVKKLFEEVPKANKHGEKITVVAAVKMQSFGDINRAIAAGITDIGDNHVQEFTEKYPYILGNPKRHFIGHLQTNKIKFLVGKIDLYHSVDSLHLAEKLSRAGEEKGVVSGILLQVNIGNEQSKSGFSFEEVEDAYAKISAMPALNIKGLMAMLPISDDEEYLKILALQMRGIYDGFKANGAPFEHLSMGMSGDWRLCVEAGSNMIRIGTAIFGERHYN